MPTMRSMPARHDMLQLDLQLELPQREPGGDRGIEQPVVPHLLEGLEQVPEDDRRRSSAGQAGLDVKGATPNAVGGRDARRGVERAVRVRHVPSARGGSANAPVQPH